MPESLVPDDELATLQEVRDRLLELAGRYAPARPAARSGRYATLIKLVEATEAALAEWQ